MQRFTVGKNARVLRPCALGVTLLLGGCNGGGSGDGDGSGGATMDSSSTSPTTITSATVTGTTQDPLTTGGSTDSDATATTTVTVTDSATDTSTTGTTLTTATDSDPSASSTTGFAETCRKVDVIFAIDNSGSMAEEIEALTGPVFDSFPAALLEVGNGIDDFHLAVIDACPRPAYYHNYGQSGACDFSTGANYMVSTSPDLTDEYQCVTELTESGWNDMQDECATDNDEDEQPARAASDSLTADAIAQANGGFLRDDALLLVVAMTDEDEELFGGATTSEISQRIIDAKGTVDEVIFLGIGGDSECDGPYGSALEASNLREITQTFVDAERGLFWDLCQGDLETAFKQAIAIVDGVCFDVIPG